MFFCVGAKSWHRVAGMQAVKISSSVLLFSFPAGDSYWHMCSPDAAL